MTWNYRLVKHVDSRTKSVWYGIHEVFYNSEGKPCGMTENPVDIIGESVQEVQNSIKLIQRDASRRPLLDLRRTKWAKST